MSIRKEEFVIGEIYHVIVRGVEGIEIFKDAEDYWRGIFSLFEFNTTSLVTIREQREKRSRFKKALKFSSGKTTADANYQQEDQRDKLVEILAFVIMPNHIHLILKQLKIGGISIFMQKLGSGYSRYFNNRYQRKGHLFQDKFKATLVGTDDYLKNVFVYVHTNPISLIEPKWKEIGIKDTKSVNIFLEEYRWSSYLDYLNKNNFSSITDRDFVTKIFGDSEKIKKFVNAWILYKHRNKV